MFNTMELEQVYFYTATILEWKKLLVKDKYKEFIIDSLRYLVNKGKIRVYGFVIMRSATQPNHIHLIWEMLAMNGKEMPHASLIKMSGHQFLEDLRQNHPQVLPHFIVDTETRKHQRAAFRFWERNSLPKLLHTPKVLEQKLDYIHANPCQEKWSLAKEPTDYYYSSAKFYEQGIDDFGFITHYKERV